MLSKRRFLVVALILGMLAVLQTAGVNAQKMALRKRVFVPQPTTPTVTANPDGFYDYITFDNRSEYTSHIDSVRDSIKEKDWPAVAKKLQTLLDLKQDFTVEIRRKDPKTNLESYSRVSVRTEANRLLGELPKAGLEAYQAEYGGNASELLDKALKFGELSMYGEVFKRYLHTDAGVKAFELLATHSLDRGEYFAAAESFRRLIDMSQKRKKKIALSPLTLFKAALAFRRAGNAKDADLAWKTLLPRLRRGSLEVKGRKIPVEQLETVLAKVVIPEDTGRKDSAFWGIDVARRNLADASAPLLEPSWWTSTVHEKLDLDDPKVENTESDAWIKMGLESQQRILQPILSGSHPVAANNLLVFRTASGVAAIYIRDGRNFAGKFRAGELAWRSNTDASLAGLLNEAANKTLMGQFKTGPQGQNNGYIQTYSQLIYENSAVGTLAIDRGKVYLVDELAVQPHPSYMMQFGGWNAQAPSYPESYKKHVDGNVLRAYDLESGKLTWQLPDASSPNDETSQSYFLGTPLPIGGKLYVLNEKKGELRLLALDPRLVDPAQNKWEVKVRTQPLCNVKEPASRDIIRRTQAVNLAYGEGILVVPTNAGALIGVDLLTQSLIWSCRYREGTPQQPQPVNPWGRPWGGQIALQDLNAGFKVSPPVITRGKVVFAAPDGASIHCIDLREGRRVWHVKRSDDLYLGGVYDKTVLMVTKNGCRALGLDDGKLLWSVATGTPTGYGVASKGLYYLPVQNADKVGEVTAIDIKKGVVKAHNRSRNPKGPLPGNLIFHEGAMLSQTPTTIAAYPQLEVRLQEITAKLEKDPDNPDALTERGELRLADGKVQGAVDDLRKALKNKPAKDVLAKARGKLYEAFSELFQEDFNRASKEYLEEYKEMCKADTAEETNRRHARFLYLVGRGREEQGRLVEAYQAYVDFGALPINKERVAVVDNASHKAPPEVWVRGRIAAMMANASEEQRKPLEAKIAKEWAVVRTKSDVDALRRFVQTFDVPFAVGREARLQLADRLMEKNDKATYLEIEMLLLQLRVASLEKDARVQARALEGLARLAIKKGDGDSMKEAAGMYRELGQKFPKIIIRDDKTGSDLFDDLATDKRFLPYLDDVSLARLTGKMKARELAPQNAQVAQNWWRYNNAFTFQPEGKVPLFFQKHRLMFTAHINNVRQLLLVDRTTNQELEPIVLNDLNLYSYYSYLQNYQYIQTNFLPNARFRFYHVQGHLAVVQIGPMVYGLDLVNRKVLWKHDMLDPTFKTVGFNIEPDPTDGSLQLRAYNPQAFVRKIGGIGNVQASYVCLQTQQGLVALDPVKGTELWTRSDIPARTQVFGDEQHIYLVEVRNGTVVGGGTCLRASDGVKVNVPDFGTLYQNRLRIVGRNLLLSEKTKDQQVLRLYDVHTGKDLWKKTFAGKSVAFTSLNPELAGVVEPGNDTAKVTVVNLRSGKEVINARLESVDLKDVKDPLLIDDGEQLYLALNQPIDPKVVAGATLYNNFANTTRCATVNGMFYAFDRKGKMRWYAKVPNQMLILEQFRNMPVAIFSTRYNMMINQFGGGRWVATTKAIDKKSGKLVCDPDPKDFNGYQFQGVNVDVKKGTIDLVGNGYLLQFYVDDGRKIKGGKEGGEGGKVNQPQPQPQPRPIRGGGFGRPIRGGFGGQPIRGRT